MAKHAVDIDKLTPAERLDLIDELWSSLEDDDVPVTEAQRRELDRRLERIAKTGVKGSPLEEVMGRLEAGRG